MQDINDNTTKVPENFRYNEEHIWMEYYDSGHIKCGITEYLCEKAGDIIALEFIRNVNNMEVDQGDTILTIESLNDSISIKTPLQGTVTEINDNCIETPELLNSDPYGDGWLFIISTDDVYEYEHQMQADEYESIVIKEKEDINFI